MNAFLIAPESNGRPSHRMRNMLWRAVFGISGGFAHHGQVPSTGCVVVANHGSHADAPALLAALGGRQVRVAAAADYWFGRPVRAAACRALVGAFAVRRHGGGMADLLAIGQILDRGGVVVVFPSGSRSADSDTCHLGAFRLAAAHNVPVVPARINGTAQLLPKSGRLHRSQVTVRIGTPIVVGSDLDAARERVRRELAQPTRSETRSPGRTCAAATSETERSTAITG